jgi:hypothetical protein
VALALLQNSVLSFFQRHRGASLEEQLMADAKVQQILKLKALAEHPNTPEAERLRATERIAFLQEKYAIEDLMLRDDHGSAEEIIRRNYIYNGVYSKALRDACCALAVALDMRALYHDGVNDEVNVTIYGFKGDFEKFESLLTSVMLQMPTAFKLWKKENAVQWQLLDSHDRYYSKRSFMMGYGSGFASRVQAGRTQAVEESGSGAELVLVDRKSRVDDHVENAHPNLKKSRDLMVNGAYHHGRAAGARANTGETTIGTRKAVK